VKPVHPELAQVEDAHAGVDRFVQHNLLLLLLDRRQVLVEDHLNRAVEI